MFSVLSKSFSSTFDKDLWLFGKGVWVFNSLEYKKQMTSGNIKAKVTKQREWREQNTTVPGAA
jgi:hypothetical protein